MKTNEPVAWMPIQSKHTRIQEAKPEDEHNWIPLYLHPAKTLTDEEIVNCWDGVDPPEECWVTDEHRIAFARAILKKAIEK